MTYEEQQDYNKLPKNQRLEYDHIKEQHPEWDHKKIIVKMALSKQMDDAIETGHEDISPNNPELIKEILRNAKRFLQECGINIESLFRIIDNAIATISYYVKYGLSYANNKIKEIWNWIFN